jgi:hypothetical protein
MTRTARPPHRALPVQEQIDILESPPPSATTAQSHYDIDHLAAQVLAKIRSQGDANDRTDKQQIVGMLQDVPDSKKHSSKTSKLKQLAVGPDPPERPKGRRDVSGGQRSLEPLLASIGVST